MRKLPFPKGLYNFSYIMDLCITNSRYLTCASDSFLLKSRLLLNNTTQITKNKELYKFINSKQIIRCIDVSSVVDDDVIECMSHLCLVPSE